MTEENPDFDILIIGGGMVGVSLACALGQQNLTIGVIEAVPFKSTAQPSYDDRVIALSYGTARIFDGMGIWTSLQEFTTPIKHIHVSERGHLGVTRINCTEEGVDALGYTVTARELGRQLIRRLKKCSDVKIISPATVTDLNIGADQANVTLIQAKKKITLTCDLVVAADGNQSIARDIVGHCASKQRDYQQAAVIANVSSEKPHDNIAYERFTPNGPLAVLPLPGNQCSVVWTQDQADVDAVMALDDDEFIQQLQACFGWRLGRFCKIGKRSSYSLHLNYLQQQIDNRLALIGNAAHTLHPIAGQGFNLGLRDVASLAQVIVDAKRNRQDIGSLATLEPYAKWRELDQRKVVRFTDTMVRIFSNRFVPLAMVRNLSLTAINNLPPIKHLLAKHTMGLAGRQPRLARGLEL